MKTYIVSLKYICCLMVLLLFGCSMGVKNFDKAKNLHIKKIAIYINESNSKIFAHSQMYFSGGGAPIIGCPTVIHYYYNDYSPQFRHAINQQNIQFASPMFTALREKLIKKGYEIIYLQDLLPSEICKEFDKYRYRYPAPQVIDYCSQKKINADAVLFIYSPLLGYRETCNLHLKGYKVGKKGVYDKDCAYIPEAFISAALYDFRSKKKIYSRFFNVGVSCSASNTVIIWPDKKYQFDSIETLINNIDEATQGLIDCQNKILPIIADNLD